MIDLYYWITPNGHKISIALEELGLPYAVHPINISKGEQFAPEFLKISPNNKIPAIVDDEPVGRDEPLAIFESGAILIYLAEKTGRLLPPVTQVKARTDVLQWLFWQVGGLGPMLGQAHHFRVYAQERVPYAIDRYTKEAARLYGVLNTALAERDYLAGDFSIADIACYPWIVSHELQGQSLDDFPNVRRWFQTVAARPSVTRAYAWVAEFQKNDH